MGQSVLLHAMAPARWWGQSQIGRLLGTVAGWAHHKLNAIGSRLWGSPEAFQLRLQIGFLLIVGLLLLALNSASTGLIGTLCWLAAAGALKTALALGREKLLTRWTFIDTLVTAWLASVVLSAAFSSVQPQAIKGLFKLTTLVLGYGSFRVLWGLPLLRNRQAIFWLLVAVMGMGVVQSLAGIYQAIGHIDPRATWQDPDLMPEEQMTRVFGLLQPANPNLLAGFLVPCLAAAIGAFALGWLVSPSIVLTLFSGLASALIAAVLVMTGSRGGFLALGAMAFLVWAISFWLLRQTAPGSAWRSYGLRAWGLITTLGLLGVAALLTKSQALRTRVLSIFSWREDSSIAYRLNVYASTARMFADNPFLGIGPGNEVFKRMYGFYMVPGFNALGAYSVPLEIAVEQGIVGLLLFAALIVSTCVKLGQALASHMPTLFDKLVLISLALAVLGTWVYGTFDTVWYRPAVNLLYWLMLAGLAHWFAAHSPADSEALRHA